MQIVADGSDKLKDAVTYNVNATVSLNEFLPGFLVVALRAGTAALALRDFHLYAEACLASMRM